MPESNPIGPVTDFIGIARLLGVSPATVKNRLRDGLPSHKVSGRRLFIVNEVLAWVASHDANGNKKTAPAGQAEAGKSETLHNAESGVTR